MNNEADYYTLKGYQLIDNAQITSSMEDYLEMVCRMLKTQEFARINKLAKRLNVKPSSASKMVNKLRISGLVTFEKYGYIKPTVSGLAAGEYLLYRHDVLNEFLCLVNHSDSETEQVEKIEHFLNRNTVNNIQRLIHIIGDKI
ncbi:MAG: metal-dependent transcriptional regulator [Acetanaerobacterium sp.]